MSLNRNYSFSRTYVLGIIAACVVLVALATACAWSHLPHGKRSTNIYHLVALTVVFATAQAPDFLLLNAKKFSIYTNPLRRFLELSPDKQWKRGLGSTANWRGYTATWQVNGDRLILVGMEVIDRIMTEPDHDESIPRITLRSVMSDVFPGQEEVFADWFTGHVIVINGERVHYVHQGYASTYEKYVILRVEKGVVTRQWDLDHAGFLRFRYWQFEQFKRTEEYRKAVVELFEKYKGWSAEQKEGFLAAFYSEKYTSQIFDSLA